MEVKFFSGKLIYRPTNPVNENSPKIKLRDFHREFSYVLVGEPFQNFVKGFVLEKGAWYRVHFRVSQHDPQVLLEATFLNQAPFSTLEEVENWLNQSPPPLWSVVGIKKQWRINK